LTWAGRSTRPRMRSLSACWPASSGAPMAGDHGGRHGAADRHGHRDLPGPAQVAQTEREAGKAAMILGLCFISEGAIPFAAQGPLRVIPASIAGGALTGALSMYFGCKLAAPTAACLCW